MINCIPLPFFSSQEPVTLQTENSPSLYKSTESSFTNSIITWVKHHPYRIATTMLLLLNEFRPSDIDLSSAKKVKESTIPDDIKKILEAGKCTLYLTDDKTIEHGNAFAGYPADIYISDSTWNSKTNLDDQGANCFLIAHEVGHIQNNHPFKTGIVNLGLIVTIPMALSLYERYSTRLFDFLLSKLEEKTTVSSSIKTCKKINSVIINIPATQIVLTLLLQSYYSRRLELQADLHGAQLTNPNNVKQDFIRQIAIQTAKKSASRLSLFEKLCSTLIENPLFARHPSEKDRCIYLKQQGYFRDHN